MERGFLYITSGFPSDENNVYLRRFIPVALSLVENVKGTRSLAFGEENGLQVILCAEEFKT